MAVALVDGVNVIKRQFSACVRHGTHDRPRGSDEMSLATAIGTHVKRNYIEGRCRGLCAIPYVFGE